MEKYYLINVLGKNGYSFMVSCRGINEDDVAYYANKQGLFDDEDDYQRCVVEEASDYDIKHFKDMIIKLN